MTYFSLESFFANSSFVFLFLSMICYWIQTSFYLKNWKFAFGFCFIANLSLCLLLMLRWVESGHFPLSNLYESLMFLSWSLSSIQLLVEYSTKQSLLGALTIPMALLTNAFATFSLPLEMQKASSLVPALQSNWLMMHVTVMILSYAALIFGSLLSMAFLILTWQSGISDMGMSSNLKSQNPPLTTFVYEYSNTASAESSSLAESPISQNSKSSFFKKTKEEFATILDNLSYRILGIGFPLLTIGILSGAVWANEAWGSYWSWDPKETWALLTWFVFAIYLHTRLNKGWKGRQSAWIASLGFFVVWMCFLGVNLIGEGLHSYGWLTK